MPMFWTRSSTTGIYKVIENFTLTPDKSQLQNDSIFGWYVDVDQHNTRSSTELRHSHISRAEFGFYNKYQKINFTPMPQNITSGSRDRFNQNDYVIDNRESTKSYQKLLELSQEPFCNSYGLTEVEGLIYKQWMR